MSLPPAHVSGQLHHGPHDGETVWMPWARIEIPMHGWEGEELVTSLYRLKGIWRGQSLAHYDYDGRASTA